MRTWTTNHSKWKIVVCVVYAPGLSRQSIQESPNPPCPPAHRVCSCLTHVRHVNFYFLLISLSDFFFVFFFLCSGIFWLCLALLLSLLVSACLGLFWVLCLSRGLCLFCLLLIWRAYVAPPSKTFWDFLAIFIYLKMKRRTQIEAAAAVCRGGKGGRKGGREVGR